MAPFHKALGMRLLRLSMDDEFYNVYHAEKRIAVYCPPISIRRHAMTLHWAAIAVAWMQITHPWDVMGISKEGPVGPAQRALALEARRQLKMASSAHAYVRGSTVQFYRWLEGHGRRAVPKGPPVWICGDCHAGNLGPLAAPDGKVHVQIRDLDQTVIGNPNHDLIRLALSLSSAARGSDLPGVTTAHMLEHMMEGYEHALATPAGRPSEERPECVRVVMRQAMNRTWKHLARERLKDLKPNIPRGERFWHLTNQEMRAIRSLCEEEDVRRLVVSLKSREDHSTVEVLDAAYWMK